ncbi:MAG: hypothetical protein ACKVP5_08375 [Aestuariivirga sp.]
MRRIHGALLKLGVEVARSTVAKCKVEPRTRPNRSCTIFPGNYVTGIAVLDLIVALMIGLKLLYLLPFLAHEQKKLVHCAVTASSGAQLVARSNTVPSRHAPS